LKPSFLFLESTENTKHGIRELKMWGGNLLFATREEAVDRHLFALAAMSDTSHDYTDAKLLQNWLSDVIGYLQALPEPTQTTLGLPSFKIGDEHLHWRADQIKSWHKERCRSLRQQLSELQHEQWRSPVGALPPRRREATRTGDV
jgi:hypothetical protein